jgi:hypothetical protein
VQLIGLIKLNGKEVVMATKYNTLRDLVRDWSNRDSQVLSDSIIESSLKYSAEEAYRKVKVPELEYTKYYVVTNDGVLPSTTGSDYPNVTAATLNDGSTSTKVVSIPVPSDLISFIMLRSTGKADYDISGNIKVTTSGKPILKDEQTSVVFNEKVDIRTFHDLNADKTSNVFWSRQGDTLVVSGNVKEDDVIEIQYYRKLSPLNFKLDLPDGLTLVQAEADTDSYEVITQTEYDALASNESATYTLISGSYVRSTKEKHNWLRDDNERVLLFGALHRVFDYLQEEDQSGKYFQRFMLAINELNEEETRRKASGGNVKINYTDFGFL